MFNQQWWSNPPAIARYMVAVASIALAALLAMAVDHIWRCEPYVSLFLCAVVLSSWFGGTKPGLVAVALATLAFDYLFVNPQRSLVPELSQIPRLVLFVGSALVVGGLSAVQRASSKALRKTRDDLAEKARELGESEARLKEAKNVAHIGYWERDVPSGRITWSDETYRIWGLQPQERAIDQSELEKMVHPDDRQIHAGALSAALRDHRPCEVEYRVIRPGGEVRFLQIRDSLMVDGLGRVTRIFGTVQDITERKQAEEFRRIQQNEIKAIVENSPDPIVRYNRDLRRIYVNPAYARVLGAPKETLLGEEVGSTVKEEDLKETAEEVEIVRASLNRVFDTAIPLDFEVTWPTPAGRRSYTVHMEPEFDPQGACVSVLSIGRDITESKRTSESVRESQELLQFVLATLPVGVAVTDKAGNIVLVNAMAKCIWGGAIHAGQERWKESRGFWHDSGKRIAPEEWASARALTKGETTLNELINVENFDGQQKIILNSAAPIRNAEGVIVGAVVVNEDVTESKKSEQRLRQVESELTRVSRLTTMGELTASIAHEVNQPLAGVVTNAEAAVRWLAATPPDIGEACEAMQRVVRDGNRAGQVIARIRSLMTKGEPSREPLDLNELVRETLALTQPELSRRQVTLQTRLAPDLPPVSADRVQLQQVLLNLVMNALDSLSSVTDRGRALQVRTNRRNQDFATVAVEDNGAGFAPGGTERLFEPFYTTKPDGVGMGLALSRSIVEAHGGRLEALRNECFGVTFQVVLPFQKEA